MSKIDEKFLQEYSLATLRDTQFSNPQFGEFVVFDGTRFVNQTLNLGDQAEAEGFNSLANQSTTSNGWVTIDTFTTQQKTSGQFLIQFTAEVAQNSNNTLLGYRAQWRQGTAGTWVDLSDFRVSFRNGGEGFDLRTGFQIINLTSNVNFQIRLQFGQTTAGGTATVRNNSVFIQRIGDLP